MASNIKTIKTLQMAINNNCPFKILYQTSQFYSKQQNRPVQKYILRKSVFDSNADKYEAEEIFSTYSQLQIILFLRDLWYVWLDKELPTDNELWESIKQRDNITLDTYKDVIKT